MSFRFSDLSWTGGTLALHWEKLVLPIRIGVDDVEQSLAAIRDTIARAKPDDWRTPYRGASFSMDAGVNLEEGTKWAEKSVAIQEGYYNVSLLARYRHKAGNSKDAVALAEKAIKLGKEAKEGTLDAGRSAAGAPRCFRAVAPADGTPVRGSS
jgi:hypothetical protein